MFALAYAGWIAIELPRVALGFDDGDDPEQSVAFLREHGDIDYLAGVASVVMALALTVLALAVAEAVAWPERLAASRQNPWLQRALAYPDRPVVAVGLVPGSREYLSTACNG